MKVINLNSEYDLTVAQINFTENVLKSCSNYRCSEPEELDVIQYLLDKTPVFLVDTATIDKYRKEIYSENRFNENNLDLPPIEEIKEPKPSSELLGLYIHNNNILGCNKPSILLCVERIVDLSANNEELDVYIAKVLIHEFAHAFMALYSQYTGGFDLFYEWIEEPLANLFTLLKFQSYLERHHYYYHRSICSNNFATKSTKSALDIVKKFISEQPENYRLGLIFFENGLEMRDFRDWYRNKSDFTSYKGKTKYLQYVSQNFNCQPQSYEWDLEVLLDFAQGKDVYECQVKLLNNWKTYKANWEVTFETTKHFTDYSPFWSKKMADKYKVKYEAWLDKKDCDVIVRKVLNP